MDSNFFSTFIAIFLGVGIYLVIFYFIPKIFSKKVRIELDLTQVKIKTLGTEKTVKPIIYVRKKGEKIQLLSIGNDTPIEPHETIYLFKPDKNSSIRKDIKPMLTVFFRNLFRQTINRNFFPFVKLELHGTKNIKPVFGENTETILSEALKKAFVTDCNIIN